MTPRRGAAATAVALLLAAGCGSDPAPSPAWRELSLPAPPGGGRVTLRDATTCDGRWFVVGGTVAPGGATRPAAWRSHDGLTWRTMTFTALPGGGYGRENIISAVACRGAEVAMVGARSGGAHGNPRVSTWRLTGDTMTENDAPFDLYGGPDAVNVARIAAGPSGFAVAGNRATGAAVWLSADATRFRLVSGVPPLAGTAADTPTANDVAVSAAGTTLVGGVRRAGRVDSDPVAWQSPDGRAWVRTELPGGTDDEVLQRVVRHGDALVAVGLRGPSFGAWRLPEGGTPWQEAGRFGATAPRGIAEVRSVTTVGDGLLAAVDDGTGYGLWLSTDDARSWTARTPPAPMASGPDRGWAVTGSGNRLLLLTDDGARARAWSAALP